VETERGEGRGEKKRNENREGGLRDRTDEKENIKKKKNQSGERR